jgi:hypothetical protein
LTKDKKAKNDTSAFNESLMTLKLFLEQLAALDWRDSLQLQAAQKLSDSPPERLFKLLELETTMVAGTGDYVYQCCH